VRRIDTLIYATPIGGLFSNRCGGEGSEGFEDELAR
jgi:hypothetical protein